MENMERRNTETPSISCPADVNKTANVETPSVAVHWSLPNATDNSGDVSLSGSNHPGSNFTIGTTVVSYEAADPSGNKASCSFIVRVKAQVKTTVTDENTTQSNVSVTKVIGYLEELCEVIDGLRSVVVSSEESQSIARDILQLMDGSILAVVHSIPPDESSHNTLDQLTQALLNAADKLSKFVLRNTEPGSGPIVLDAQFILLHLESNLVNNLTNSSIILGDGNGFTTPAADKLFSVSPSENINRICTRLKRKSFQARIDSNFNPMNDVLSLTFSDRGDNDFEVNNTEDNIIVMFDTDPPPPVEQTFVRGTFLEVQNVTYFGLVIEVHQLFHAVIIWFENSQAVFGNSTVYIFNERPNCTYSCRGYQFSVVGMFHGDYSTIFIPEHYFLRSGEYYVTFTIRKCKYSDF
ncbi:uncharacterized protein [Ptychodera flava]|uniref:uncharacterized protein n=1 Tax=Ptychodera flava TaxID=63121 RepID=UPI00396A4183